MLGRPSLRAGSERALHLSARKILAAGHEVFLLHGSAEEYVSNDYTEIIGLEGVFTRSLFLPGIERVKNTIAEFMRDRGIDVVHIHDWPHPAIFKWLCRHWPVVVTVHVVLCPNGARYNWGEQKSCARQVGLECLTTGYFRLGCGHLSNGKVWRYAGFISSYLRDHRLRAQLKRVDRVIVNGKWIRDQLIADGIASGQIAVVPPPVSELMGVCPGAEDDPPALCFVGRLVSFKGPHHLLYASALMQTPHEVWFVGDGPMRKELEVLATELGVATRVRFCGEFDADDVDSVRARCRVAVVPSLAPETFCLAGAEALRIGKPVVAYGVGGIPDWLIDGECGYVVPPGSITELANKLMFLLEHPAEAQRMGLAGQALAKAWWGALHAAKLIEEYNRVVGKWADVDTRSKVSFLERWSSKLRCIGLLNLLLPGLPPF